MCVMHNVCLTVFQGQLYWQLTHVQLLQMAHPLVQLLCQFVSPLWCHYCSGLLFSATFLEGLTVYMSLDKHRSHAGQATVQ